MDNLPPPQAAPWFPTESRSGHSHDFFPDNAQYSGPERGDSAHGLESPAQGEGVISSGGSWGADSNRRRNRIDHNGTGNEGAERGRFRTASFLGEEDVQEMAFITLVICTARMEASILQPLTEVLVYLPVV